MSKISDQELLLCNQQGLIPGPSEDEDDFVKRVEFCRNLKHSFKKTLGNEIPADLNIDLSRSMINEIAPITKNLFDIIPEWVPIIFSNYKMLPWHGGSAWIFQLTEESPTAAFFQLRESFATSPKYLGIYDRKELLAHESAHIGRMMFEEPKFEEYLAYRTSHSSFRKWFGPIVQSSWESLFFVFILLLSFLSDLAIAVSGYPDPHHSTIWIKLIPAALIVIGLGRLLVRHWQFSRCLKKLAGILGKEKADAVIYRLQDEEIIKFAKMTPVEISQYTSEQHSLRWHLISKAYFI